MNIKNQANSTKKLNLPSSKRLRSLTLASVLCLLLLTGISSAYLAVHPTAAKGQQGPVNLVVWDSGRYIQLNWDADLRTTIQAYNIYRSLKTPDNWEKLNETPFHFTTFVDYSAPRSEVVFYRVSYVNENEEKIQTGSITEISTNANDAPTQIETILAYDKNNVITDQQLTNADAMSADQIQRFLTSQGSILATYSTGEMTAAQHIYNACQTHGISPYVVLVTLQKEKGLIKSGTANPDNFAMGWNTGDSSTSDFANQIYYGTRQFKLHYDNLGHHGRAVGKPHAVSDGTVTAANTATIGLYIYTPWIGHDNESPRGVGGNYLFWDLWYNTFGFGDLNLAALCGPQPDSFYLRFPLQGSTAYSRLINSVMDHSMTTLYGTDNNVTGFSGEIGLAQYGQDGGGYKNSQGMDFLLNGAYRGANNLPVYLYYDGHPGVDYRAGCGTNVYAAVSGTVHYPASITGIKNAANYHVLEIVPDPPNDNYRIYYLHLATYKNITNTASCVDEPAVVSDGDHVAAGVTLIGRVGRKGTTVEHLHFEVQKNVNGTFVPVDPYGWQGQYPDPRGIGSNTNLWKPKAYASCDVRWHPDGTLVTANGGSIYLIEGGQKRLIPSTTVFYAYGYDFANVVNISQEEFDCTPTGLNLGLPPSSRLRNDNGTIYEITDRNFKRAFPSPQIFQGQGFRWSDVQTGSVAGIPGDTNIPVYTSPFREGSLIQASGSPSIYIISNSKKRLFATSSAFLSLGYRFEDVIITDSATVSNITTGASITDSLITTCSSGGSSYTITVSASPSAGGTVSGGGTFPAGGSRTVTATANSGYTFTNWTENGSVVSSLASYTFTLNANRNLVANFGGAPLPESPHPYSHNLNQTWAYTLAGSPTSINITFDPQTSVEQGFDYIYVMDGNNNNIAGSPFTGASLAGQIKNVPGGTVRIRLTSDSSIAAWGFRITSITVGSIPAPPPAAPSNLQAVAVSSSQVNLNWTDSSNNEIGFKVQRRTGATGAWSEIAAVGQNVTSYQNTGLSANTTYYYSVTSYNNAGQSNYSNIINVTTPAVITALPESLHPYSHNLNQTWAYTLGNNPASINVTFDSQTSVEQGFDYIYVMDGNGNNVAGSPFTGTSLAGQIKNVPGGTVRIRLTSDSSIAAWGFRVTSITVGSIPTPPPAAPSNLQAVAVSSSQLNLNWTDNSNNETGFKIQRRTGVSGVWTEIATVGQNVRLYQNIGLSPNTTYYYSVTSYNSAGQSIYSNVVGATTQSGAPQQLLMNPGFESGAAIWTSTGVGGSYNSVIAQAPPEAHTGSWVAWFNGQGRQTTYTLSQVVSIPSSAATANLSFWLRIYTEESLSTPYDRLTVEIRNEAGTSVLATLATYSNQNGGPSWVLRTFDLSAFRGQRIMLYFKGTEDSTIKTSFFIDDTALNVQ